MQAVESFFQIKVDMELQIPKSLKQCGPWEAGKDRRACRYLQLFPCYDVPGSPSDVSCVCHGTQFECLHKHTNVGCVEGNILKSLLYTSFLKPIFVKITIHLSQDKKTLVADRKKKSFWILKVYVNFTGNQTLLIASKTNIFGQSKTHADMYICISIMTLQDRCSNHPLYYGH